MAVLPDWLSRQNLPDMYPRLVDPYSPGAALIPANAPGPSTVSEDQLTVTNVWDGWVTMPGSRPIVYQRALNFNITANVTPVPLTSGPIQCELIIVDVDSSQGASAFFGYGNSINATSGIEVQPGLPISLSVDNDREEWEKQRVLEAIAGMIAAERGYNPMGTYRAPRVVFNANEYFIMAAGALPVRIMLLMTPEYQ